MAEEVDLTGVPRFDTLELIKTGLTSVAFAADGSTETTTLAHGLNFVPIVMAFLEYEVGSNTYQYPIPRNSIYDSGAEAGFVYQTIGWYADETNVYFYNQSQLQGTAGGNIRYYLLRQRSSN